MTQDETKGRVTMVGETQDRAPAGTVMTLGETLVRALAGTAMTLGETLARVPMVRATATDEVMSGVMMDVKDREATPVAARPTAHVASVPGLADFVAPA